MSYGQEPEVVGSYPLEIDEMMLYLYMPIYIPDSMPALNNIPKQLWAFNSMTQGAINHSVKNGENFDYWYLTVKRTYVEGSHSGNRPGWHSDGYRTNDVNYIWADVEPTEFAIQEFPELSEDCHESLEQMWNLITRESIHSDKGNIKTYGVNNLIRLDQFNIHQAPHNISGGMRTFFKLTGSNSKFNLKGNTHNHLMDYEWKMRERQKDRNMESAK